MDPEQTKTSDHHRWQKIRSIFEAALEQDVDQRISFLEHECGDDPSMRLLIEKMLKNDEGDEHWTEGDDRQGMPPSMPGGGGELEGSRLGPYEIVRELGRGGIGVVYIGKRQDGRIRKYVAIKILRKGVDSDDILARFRQERRILAGLEHPQIARFYDAGSTALGQPYFVMEYVEGAPITDFCDSQGIDLTGRLELFLQLCRAAAFAHRNLVVHRDLKPANVLVTSDRQVKLLDFGIAKILNPHLVGHSIQLTLPAERLLTPAYASPEQIRGDLVTVASDVYSLGMILFQLLTGDLPYDLRSGTIEEMHRILEETEPPRPSTVMTKKIVASNTNQGGGKESTTASRGLLRQWSRKKIRRHLRGDLDNIVLKAIQKETARRYETVEQLAADVDAYLAGRPVSAQRDTLAYRLRKYVKRHRWQVSFAATLVIAGAVIGGQAIVQSRRLEEERRNAQRAVSLIDELLEQFSSAVVSTAKNPQHGWAEIDSLELLEQFIPIFEDSNFARQQANLSMIAGQGNWYRGDVERARRMFADAAAIYRNLGHRLGEAGAYGNLAMLTPGADEKIEYLTRAEDVFASLEDWEGVATTKANLGFAFYESGQLSAARRSYRQAAERFDALENNVLAARARLDLADVAREMGDVDEAEKILRQLLQRASEHTELSALICNNLGETLAKKGSHEEAKDFFRLALNHARDSQDLYTEAIAALNLANRLIESKELEEAEGLIRIASDWFADDQTFLPLTIKSQLVAARFAKATGDEDKAAQLAREAKATAGEMWTEEMEHWFQQILTGKRP